MPDVMYIPDCGKNKLVELMLGKNLAQNLILKLFVDNETITNATVATDFTEMSTHGYAAKTLAMASWGVPAVGGDGKSSSSYAQQVWPFTAAATVNVYGYFIIMATAGTLLWCCKFGAAKPITYAGETISVTPQMKFDKVA